VRFGTHCNESERTELRDQSSSHLAAEVGRYSAPDAPQAETMKIYRAPRELRARR
jgi:hypothetical protein